MKIIAIPAYRTKELEWHLMDKTLVGYLRDKGQLKDVEVEVDEGFLLESPTGEGRDEEFFASINLGMIRKVKEYSQLGKHDAIVILGVLSPGFAAARALASVPVTGQMHSVLHVASTIGKRFGMVHMVASSALMIRKRAEEYGFGDNLVSIRYIGRSSTYLFHLISKFDTSTRSCSSEIREVIDATVAQCVIAIEKDRVDTLIISVEPLQILEPEIRERLDAAGYGEIPIVCEFSAGVEMAKLMVSAKLMPAARAYPNARLKAPPEFY